MKKTKLNVLISAASLSLVVAAPSVVADTVATTVLQSNTEPLEYIASIEVQKATASIGVEIVQYQDGTCEKRETLLEGYKVLPSTLPDVAIKLPILHMQSQPIDCPLRG